MLEVLSTELARRNPKAYIAHFQRLDPDAQRAWVGRLTPDEHRLHLAVVGGAAVLGLVLSLTGVEVELSATLAGASLGTARGWDGAKALQAAAFERAEQLGGSLTVTGLLQASLEALETGSLKPIGWALTHVELWPGLCGGPSSWRVSGELPHGGSFWSAAQALPDADAGEPRLRRLAERAGATFQVRGE